MTCRPSAATGHAIGPVAGAAIWIAICAAGVADSADGTFESVYEPSGVTALPDGTLVVLDDEAGTALHAMRIRQEGDRLSLVGQAPIDAPAAIARRWRLGRLDDLEGACHDAAGRALVIGSHNTDAGIDDTDRRKVVRFTLRSGRLHDVALRRDLRQDLLEALPAVRQAMRDGGKHDARLDIEALACDRRRDRLLIGLRSPREDERAMIVVLTNADAWFDDGADPQFERPVRTLELDKGGIRAMAYDATNDALLIVSRRESGKGGRFKAWWQDATLSRPPRQLRLPHKGAFDDVEGVTMLDDADAVLFVRDDGNRDKGRTGSWFHTTRTALGLPGGTP